MLDAKKVLDQGLRPVYRESDDSWRHGAYVTEVYKDEEDGTFWMFQYRLSTDGETNELMEGFASVDQVWPVEVVTTEYTTTLPPDAEKPS